MTTGLKIVLNQASYDALDEKRGEYASIGPVLDRLEQRRQGIGVAYHGTGSAEELRELQIFLQDASAEAAAQERGSGGAQLRKTLDRAANRLGSVLAEAGAGDGTISPRGLPMKGKAGEFNPAVHAEHADPLKAWTMEPKLDGWRVTVHAVGDESGVEVQVWIGAGRENVAAKVPELVDELERSLLPGTILDGEICVLTDGDRPDNWGGISSILQAGADNRKYDQARKQVSFVAFDVIADEGVDLRDEPFCDRRSALVQILDIPALQHVTPVASLPPSQETIDALLARGYEGAMIKLGGAKYRTGKRIAEITKVKPKKTADVRICGFTEGRGDFTGYIGAIEFEGALDDGTEISGRCSGMSWAERVEFTERQDELTGRWMEITYLDVHPSGGVKSPNYKRLRPDKDKENN